MAKINTEFSFQDNVTEGLNRINESINRLISSFQNMQGNIGNGVNPALNNISTNATNASQGLNKMGMKLLSINNAMQIISRVKGYFQELNRAVEECVDTYNYQYEQEIKLSTIMQQRMNATDAEIQSIKDLASEQQKLGIYGDEVILQGAQELASFTSNTEAIKKLVPAMNNLIAQQYGYSASGQQFQSTADMMGKVLSGQTGALSRMGYIFSEEEKHLLKTGTEMERASVLAKIITDNVGEMNQSLAQTPAGQMQQLNNAVGDTKENIGKLLMPWQAFVKSIGSKIKMKAFEMIEKGLKWLNEHMKEVKIALMVLIGAVATGATIYIGKIIAVKIATITANKEMAMAWLAGAWPIALIIGLIAGISVGLFQLLKNSETVFPAVGGFITAMLAVSMNVRYKIWNGIKTLIEGIVNGVRKMWITIIGLGMKHAVEMLTPIQKIAEGMDNVFGSNLSSGLTQKINTMKSIADAVDNGKFENLPGFGKWEWKLGGENGELSDQEKLMQYYGNMSFNEAWNSGQELGKQLGAEASDKFQNWVGDVKDTIIGGAKDTVQAIMGSQTEFKTDGSGALVVSDKNLVNIADDYRELLSKRATERFNLQYKSITPSINISHMEVNENADVDGVFDTLDRGLNEFAGASLGRAS